MKSVKEKYNEKLKLYHSKLVKVFSDIKELKQSKYKLLLVVEEYSKHVNRWRDEIEKVSNQFTIEMEILKSKNSDLTKSNNDLTNECHALKNQLNIYLESYIVDNKNGDKATTNMEETRKTVDNNVEEVTNLSSNQRLSKENILLNEKIKKHVEKITEYQLRKDEIEVEKNKLIENVESNENIKIKVETFEEEINSLVELISTSKKELNKLKEINHERNTLIYENKILKERLLCYQNEINKLKDLKSDIIKIVNINNFDSEKCDLQKQNSEDFVLLKDLLTKLIKIDNTEFLPTKMIEKYEDEKTELEEQVTMEDVDMQVLQQLIHEFREENIKLNEVMSNRPETVQSCDELSQINYDLECRYTKLKTIIEKYSVKFEKQLRLKDLCDKLSMKNTILHSECKKVIKDIENVLDNESFEKNNLQEYLDEYKKRIDEIDKTSLENDYSDNNKHPSVLENIEEKLVVENEELRNKIRTDEEAIIHLKNDYDGLIEKNNDLEGKLSEMNVIVKNIHENKLLLEKSLAEITKQKNECDSFINNLNIDIENQNSNNKKLELENKRLKEEKINNLEIQNSLTRENEDLIHNINLLKQEIENSTSKYLELENESKISKENDNKIIDELKNQKDKINKKLNNVEKELETLQRLGKEKSDLEIQSKELVRKEIQVLFDDNNQLKQEIEKYKIQFSKLESENKTLINSLQNSENDISKKNQILSDENKILSDKINILKQEIENDHIRHSELENEISRKNQNLSDENKDLIDKINQLKFEIENHNIRYSELEADRNNLKNQKNELNKQFSKIQNEIKGKKYDLSILKEEFHNNIIELKQEIVNINIQFSKLEAGKEELSKNVCNNENEIKNYQRDISELQNQLTISKRENAELLREMNDMNQVLKERGETISKQQENAQELLKKLQTSEQKIESTTNQQGEKDEKIKILEQEVAHLRDSLPNTSRDHDGCGDSEVMSTSTVSRLEESARLKDLEGSWEERYTKLRTLALKLKGKVKELTEQLNLEKNERTEAHAKATSLLKNLQTMQTQYDHLQDDRDTLSADNRNYVKKIDGFISENDNLKESLKTNDKIIEKLKLELDLFKKNKEGGDSAIKQFVSQIQGLKKEIESYSITSKELENEIIKLSSKIDLKNEELQKEIKAHEETKKMLDSLHKECKKKTVLSLEMEDYERTLKEKVQELEKKNETINELKKKLNNEKDVSVSIKEQTHILENRIMTEERKCKELELKLMESMKKFNEAELIISQKENRLKETIKKLEDMTISNEELNTQLAQLLIQHQKQVETLRTEKDSFKIQVLALEEKVKDFMASLKQREEELQQIQNEFSNYKVRAQSVLKQNNTRDVGKEERLNEEVNTLHTQIGNINSQLESTSMELQNIKSQNEANEMKKSKLTSRVEELEILLEKQKDEMVILKERLQQTILEHREENRLQKIHTETLVQCYKQQLAEQSEQYTREISELRSQKQSPHEEYIETNLRPDAEGTESIDSASNTGNSKKPIGLEKLLNMNADLSATSQDTELAECRDQLAKHESQIAHLTELLADAEQDLAKHIQLNQILKEEIRRQQRSVEREKHAENLEYMKNVVFKVIY